jgi:uncharacterized protein (TIGR03118 family)
MKTRSKRAVIEPLDPRILLTTSPLITQTNLVSDGVVSATHTDPYLLNPWGIAIGSGGDIWIGNNNSGTSTFYTASGSELGLVSIPLPAGAAAPSGPTGVVVNHINGFDVSENGNTAPSDFIFVTEQGIIAGWSSSVDFSNAITAVDLSSTGAVFKGATTAPVANNPNHRHLYVTDFANDKIDEFNPQFQLVSRPGAFTDPSIPAGYAPFGIQRLDGKLFVTYALQDQSKQDELFGRGDGYVDEYSTTGVLLQRFASNGTLDAPWGLAVAPSNFGDFAGDILVGNFGNGRISAFSPSGTFEGKLLNTSGTPLIIKGLWSLTPGTANAGGADTLFFDAGPNDQADGIFGTLTVDAPSASPVSSPSPW